MLTCEHVQHKPTIIYNIYVCVMTLHIKIYKHFFSFIYIKIYVICKCPHKISEHLSLTSLKKKKSMPFRSNSSSEHEINYCLPGDQPNHFTQLKRKDVQNWKKNCPTRLHVRSLLHSELSTLKVEQDQRTMYKTRFTGLRWSNFI